MTIEKTIEDINDLNVNLKESSNNLKFENEELFEYNSDIEDYFSPSSTQQINIINDPYENIIEQMTKEADLSHISLNRSLSFNPLDNPLVLELQETIKSYQEKEETYRHEKEYWTANNSNLGDKLYKLKCTNATLTETIRDLNHNLKSINDITEEALGIKKENNMIDELKKYIEKNLSDNKGFQPEEDNHIELLTLELNQKEREIETCDDSKMLSQLSRSVLNIKSKISRLKTEKALASSFRTTNKLNKSLNCIEKE